MEFGLRAAPLLCRLHQPVLRVVELIQQHADRGQRFGSRRQPHVDGVALQVRVRLVPALFGFPASGFGLASPLVRGQEFARAGGRVHQRLSQRLLGRGATPFLLGLAAVRFESLEFKRQGHSRFGQGFELSRYRFQALLARQRACGVTDVDRLRLAPRARQCAQAIAPIRRHPGFGGIVDIAACHAGKQAGDCVGLHRSGDRNVGAQPVGQRRTGRGRALDPLSIQPRRLVAVGDYERAVGCDPGIEQT